MTRPAGHDALPEPTRLLLELLVDLMRGDVVDHDTACRHVANAFITAHESLMRHLVADHVLPWHSLAQAMNTYCIRRVLLRTPDPAVLVQSVAVVQGLQQLARFLQHSEQPRCASELATLGTALATQTASLHTRYDAATYAQLIDSLSEVVMVYLIDTSAQLSLGGDNIQNSTVKEKEIAVRAIDPRFGPGMPLGGLAQGVRRFAAAAKAYRTAVKRTREAALDAVADTLLFDHSSTQQEQQQQQQHSSASSVTQDNTEEEDEGRTRSAVPGTQRPRRELHPPRDSVGEACRTLDGMNKGEAADTTKDTSFALQMERSLVIDESPLPHAQAQGEANGYSRPRPVLLNNASGLTELNNSHNSSGVTDKGAAGQAEQHTPVQTQNNPDEEEVRTAGMDDVTAFIETQAHKTDDVRS